MNAPPERVMSIREVAAVTGRCRAQIWIDIQAGKFPEPIATGPRTRVWLSSEVRAWQDERIAERDASRADRAAGLQPDPASARNGAVARAVAHVKRGRGRPRKHPAPPQAAA